MYHLIQGGIAKDHRGQIRFVNDFDMKDIKRFYIIKNTDLELTRGWRAHKIEQRWFYVLSGSFQFGVVKIDDWISPNRESEIEKFKVLSIENRIIHVPKGFGTAFKALEQDSEILVFSDFPIEHACFDDHSFDLDYFKRF
ncbi:WxcM-like domain-containing protein [Sphingobacterium daejeonense]|uniref:WxcM-like domain-containing protein n=1 Tax=Sphingobacterium daejeonense TaxID=371142 RepID=UPI0021A962CA|nr:WxcM-like domain-containing protein [Sphingobacterium daejeonense]MCT1532632.1 WxcM-like domain-containing protein [Sphingobacterium daejeonense]